MQTVHFRDLRLIDYKKCWDYQETLFTQAVEIKLANRSLPPEQQQSIEHHLLFCEHPHVYTLGKSGSEENLLVSPHELKASHASFYKINRGGDITYHGPGQIVGYPIFDLDNFFTDIHKYLRFIEDAVIITLAEYAITAGRIDGRTGVWVDHKDLGNPRKICAIGVKCSRWVTMHGFALNVNTNLDYFDKIVPCGIHNAAVTSMKKELGAAIDLEDVKEKLKANLSKTFNFNLVENLVHA